MDRALRRIVGFAVPPMLAGFLFGPTVYLLKTSGRLSEPPAGLAAVGGSLFLLAALGISYGVLSASWDEAVEGSALGWAELRANLPVLRESIPFLRAKRREL